MDVGFAPSSIVPTVSLKTSASESGAFIGGSKKNEGIEQTFTITDLDPTWVRDNWVPFVIHAQSPKTFMFSWDSLTNPSECVLGWTTKTIPVPTYKTPLLMQLSFTFEGLL